MAGDWIKMRTNIDTDPRTVQIAAALDIPVLHAVGLLFKVWSWADQHSIGDDTISINPEYFDTLTGVSGFSVILIDTGWLKVSDTGISFPNFYEHNGSTAKSRALGANRQKKYRDTTVTPDTSPEKRREDIKYKKEIDTRFDTFWEAYPKKQNKAKALKAWRKISPSPDDLERFLVALRVQKQSRDWLKQEGQFIPYASTWLNGERWEDVQPDLQVVDDGYQLIPQVKDSSGEIDW